VRFSLLNHLSDMWGPVKSDVASETLALLHHFVKNPLDFIFLLNKGPPLFPTSSPLPVAGELQAAPARASSGRAGSNELYQVPARASSAKSRRGRAPPRAGAGELQAGRCGGALARRGRAPVGAGQANSGRG
jgi:hypothetical protein